MSKIETATRYRCDGCGLEGLNPSKDGWGSCASYALFHNYLVIGAGVDAEVMDYCPDCIGAMKSGLKSRARQPYQAIDPVAIINEICRRRGISRRKLCLSMGVKDGAFTRLFSGQVKGITTTTLNKIIAWDNSQP